MSESTMSVVELCNARFGPGDDGISAEPLMDPPTPMQVERQVAIPRTPPDAEQEETVFYSCIRTEPGSLHRLNCAIIMQQEHMHGIRIVNEVIEIDFVDFMEVIDNLDWFKDDADPDERFAKRSALRGALDAREHHFIGPGGDAPPLKNPETAKAQRARLEREIKVITSGNTKQDNAAVLFSYVSAVYIAYKCWTDGPHNYFWNQVFNCRNISFLFYVMSSGRLQDLRHTVKIRAAIETRDTIQTSIKSNLPTLYRCAEGCAAFFDGVTKGCRVNPWVSHVIDLLKDPISNGDVKAEREALVEQQKTFNELMKTELAKVLGDSDALKAGAFHEIERRFELVKAEASRITLEAKEEASNAKKDAEEALASARLERERAKETRDAARAEKKDADDARTQAAKERADVEVEKKRAEKARADADKEKECAKDAQEKAEKACVDANKEKEAARSATKRAEKARASANKVDPAREARIEEYLKAHEAVRGDITAFRAFQAETVPKGHKKWYAEDGWMTYQPEELGMMTYLPPRNTDGRRLYKHRKAMKATNPKP